MELSCDFHRVGDTLICHRCGVQRPYHGDAHPFRKCGQRRDESRNTILLTQRRTFCSTCRECPGMKRGARPCQKRQWEIRIEMGFCPKFVEAGLAENPLAGRRTESTADAEPYDVMIPLGSRSIWDDNEVRYAMRSIFRNFVPLGKVFLVGHRPKWLDSDASGLVYLKTKDPFARCKDANMIRKVLIACEAGISRRFLRLSDDQLVLQPSTPADLPPVHSGPIRRSKIGKYGKKLWRTRLMTEARGIKEPRNYDTHAPAMVDRDDFVRVFSELPFGKNRETCWTINSTFFNLARPADAAPAAGRHCVLPNGPFIPEMTSGFRTMNYRDASLTPELKEWLAVRFPEPAAWEKDHHG